MIRIEIDQQQKAQVSIKNINQLLNLVRKEAKQSHYYKALNRRNFHKHAAYPEFKTVACDLAIQLMTANDGVKMKAGRRDVAYYDMLHSAWLAYKEPRFPVYAIEKHLIEAFLQTDLPQHVCSVKQMFKTALFVFPQLPDLKTPDGDYIRWIFVTHALADESFFYDSLHEMYETFFEKRVLRSSDAINSYNRLRWVAILNSQYTYSASVDLPEDEARPISGPMVIDDSSISFGRNNDEFIETEL